MSAEQPATPVWGYIVLVRLSDGENWGEIQIWEGDIYPNWDTADEARGEAEEDGYEAWIAALTPVEDGGS